MKVYTATRLRALFDGFEDRRVFKRQLMRERVAVPAAIWLPLDWSSR